MKNPNHTPDPERQVQEHFDSLPVLAAASEVMKETIWAIKTEREAQEVVDGVLEVEEVLIESERIVTQELLRARREERTLDEIREAVDGNWGEFLSPEQFQSDYFWDIVIAEEAAKAKKRAGIEGEMPLFPKLFSHEGRTGLVVGLESGPLSVDLFVFEDSKIILEIIRDERMPVPEAVLYWVDDTEQIREVSDEVFIKVVDMLRSVQPSLLPKIDTNLSSYFKSRPESQVDYSLEPHGVEKEIDVRRESLIKSLQLNDESKYIKKISKTLITNRNNKPKIDSTLLNLNLNKSHEHRYKLSKQPNYPKSEL